MGDFQSHQVRALMDIEKDQEILTSYRNTEEFVFGSRESRRQLLLEVCRRCQCERTPCRRPRLQHPG